MTAAVAVGQAGDWLTPNQRLCVLVLYLLLCEGPAMANKLRVFILPPFGPNAHWTVCETTAADSLDDIYLEDRYLETGTAESLEEAKQMAAQKGVKRPTVFNAPVGEG